MFLNAAPYSVYHRPGVTYAELRLYYLVNASADSVEGGALMLRLSAMDAIMTDKRGGETPIAADAGTTGVYVSC